MQYPAGQKPVACAGRNEQRTAAPNTQHGNCEKCEKHMLHTGGSALFRFQDRRAALFDAPGRRRHLAGTTRTRGCGQTKEIASPQPHYNDAVLPFPGRRLSLISEARHSLLPRGGLPLFSGNASSLFRRSSTTPFAPTGRRRGGGGICPGRACRASGMHRPGKFRSHPQGIRLSAMPRDPALPKPDGESGGPLAPRRSAEAAPLPGSGAAPRGVRGSAPRGPGQRPG
jgi:hypothetical protein